MQTECTIKKTPHAKSKELDVFGNQIIKRKLVWCFDHGPNSKLVKRWVHISEVYVRQYHQDDHDNEMTSKDVRDYHIDVWSQKTRNYKRHGQFKTNYELKELKNRATIEIFMGV